MASLQSIARDALDTIKVLVPNAVVAVRMGAQSTTGVRGPKIRTPNPGDMGNMGWDENTVRVPADELDEPARGATLFIDGNPVYCIDSRLDPVGANRFISFGEEKPQTGVEDI